MNAITGALRIMGRTVNKATNAHSCPYCGHEYKNLSEEKYFVCDCGHELRVVYRCWLDDYEIVVYD